MTKASNRPVLIISIDLPKQDQLGSESRRQAIAHLIATVRRQRLTATWALHEPARDSHLLGLDNLEGQELALLAPREWVGVTASRQSIGRDLSRHVAIAQAAGISLSTVAVRSGVLSTHLDLLVKQEIKAVRVDAAQDAEGQKHAQRTAASQALHYGVWEIPVSYSLPVVQGWRGMLSRQSARRRITKAIRQRGVVHLLIDAAEVGDAGKGALQSALRTLEFAGAQQARGSLQIETVAAAADRLSQVRRTTPARSILRKAA